MTTLVPMWEHCEQRNVFLCSQYEDRIGIYKVLVSISKSSMLQKISIFTKPLKKKSKKSYVSMIHIKIHSTGIAVQMNTTFTAHVSAIFLADLASILCG